MSNVKKLMMTAAGGGGLNVEDVFSTFIYDGTSSAQTITNGIDLSTEGGLVWTKNRDTAGYYHNLIDTERGISNWFRSDANNGNISTLNNAITSFNSNGYSLGTDTYAYVNNNGKNYASWTFRKAPKFFDVVTYTGNGSSGRTVSHNLGSVPGCIFIKRTSSTEDWVVYHVGADATSPEDYYFKLNTTAARIDSTAAFNDTAPTSTEFTLGNNGDVNASSETYVAYLFAHNDGDGDFGPTGDQDIIKCGSYSQSSASDVDVDLGFEPQFLILKRSDDISQWFVLDEMRGFLAGNTSNSSRTLYANLTNAEADFTIQKTATGFTWPAGQFSVSAGTYIYIAIRRGPMAVPEDATDVFSMDMNGTTNNHYDANHVVDFAFYKSKDNAYDWNVNSRLMQGKSLKFNKTDAESSNTLAQFDVQNGWADSAALTSEYPTWMWKRAPNYFDVVAYTGDGTAGRDIPHNLGVTPEMIWVKKRSSATDSDWAVYHTGLDQPYHYIRLNLTNAYLNDPQAFDSGNHTSTTFSVGLNARTNGSSGQDYIAYLFASLDGVSKVGSYTGNGSTQNIDCGFSSGARFVLIKGADYATNWYVFDTERGIVAGNDAEIYLDSTSAQATTRDLIDPYSAGFTMTGNGVTNTSGKKYIFYAIA